MGQLNEEDRDNLIKEARQAALHDVSQALARSQDKHGQTDPEMARFARYFSLYLGQRLTEVANDGEGSGYPKVSGRRVWESDE